MGQRGQAAIPAPGDSDLLSLRWRGGNSHQASGPCDGEGLRWKLPALESPFCDWQTAILWNKILQLLKGSVGESRSCHEEDFVKTFSPPPIIFISWRLITLKYCSGFCHTLTWISHGFTCVPHPEPPSHFPPHPIPLGHPIAPAPSTCLIHPTWTGDLFHTW